MTNADKFKNIFGLYATELWSMPEKGFLKWLNSEAMNCSEIPNNSDTISRQAAIDALDQIFESLAIDKIKTLPSVQQEIIHCRGCKYAHLTYGGDCKYCDKWLDDDGFNLTLYLDGDFYCGYAERLEE